MGRLLPVISCVLVTACLAAMTYPAAVASLSIPEEKEVVDTRNQAMECNGLP